MVFCMSRNLTNHSCIKAMDSASLSVTAQSTCDATALFNCGDDHVRAAAAATAAMTTEGGVDGGELLLFVVTTCAVCGGSFNERHKKEKINEDTWFRNTRRKAAN